MTDTFYKYRRPLPSVYWKKPNNYDESQNSEHYFTYNSNPKAC